MHAPSTLASLPWTANRADPVLERLQPRGMPLLYEDEGLEMGESTLHSLTCYFLFCGLNLHFARRRNYHVFTNLNLYYSSQDPTLYISPDIMLVKSSRKFDEDMASYEIGKDGPAPCMVTEVLSNRTWQEGDMTNKPPIYSALGVEEYLVVDVKGKMLPQKLVLLRRQRDGSWLDEQDADGGITSQLGFRLLIDADRQLRVASAVTGEPYPRPDEAALELWNLRNAYKKEVQLRQRIEGKLSKLLQQGNTPSRTRRKDKKRGDS
jgi:Uma2 family endonuclease